MDTDKIENKTTLWARVVKNIKADIKFIMKLLAVGLVLWAGVNVLMKFLPDIATQLPLPVYDFFDSITVNTEPSLPTETIPLEPIEPDS